MTLFINLRATSVGGLVAAEAVALDGGDTPLSPAEFAQRVSGRDLVLATHGFNVDQASGLQALSLWEQACPLPPNALFVGVLWPGDSRIPILVDYVYEGVEAIASGKLLAAYLNRCATDAASLSLASHSLGARMVLETVRGLAPDVQVRQLTLMAGAIENDCLTREYADEAARVQQITTLASTQDAVLQWAFPAGNLVGEILMHGHPYDRTAIGRSGPRRPWPSALQVDPWQLPEAWDYGHLDYLPKQAVEPAFALPVARPGPDAALPRGDDDGPWKPTWSAGVLASKSR
jgi:hypothetical protein